MFFGCAWMLPHMDVAARKNVEMERARYEFEEHLRVCVCSLRAIALLPQQGVSPNLKQLVA